MPPGVGYGLSFSPTETTNGAQERPGGAPAASPLQDAIRVLSLRIPRVTGPGGIAAAPLLQSQGAAPIMGQMGAQPQGMPAGFDQFLQMLFGQMRPAAPGGSPMPSVSSPLPRIEPGVQAPPPMETRRFGPGELPGAGPLRPSVGPENPNF